MTDRMLCIGCHQPMKENPEASKPGEIHFHPCACGAIGIYREGDKYQEIHRKKVNTVPYEKSPYRGGLLR